MTRLVTAGPPRVGPCRPARGRRRLRGMTPEPSHPIAPAGVHPATDPTPAALEGENREAYAAAARWTAIRQRQAAHDGAVVVDAYLRGYLDGMRDEAEGRASADPSAADEPPVEEPDRALDPSPATPDTPALPDLAALEIRARLEGYADGLRWREHARRGGLLRLSAYRSGKSTRRFAAEDLMRSPRRVRRMLQDREFVEDSIRDELLRRLAALRDPDAERERLAGRR